MIDEPGLARPGMADAPADVTAVAADLVVRLARALRMRVDSQRRAQQRLAAFAFTEAPASRPSDAAAAADSASDAEYFLATAIRSSGDPATLRMLQGLRGGGRPLDELESPASAGSGRLALADWIGSLTSAGLIVRELERDDVSLTPLGEALVDLVAEVVRRAAEREP